MNMDSNDGDRLVEWGDDDPSIVVDVRGYSEPARPAKELTAGEIILIILLPLAGILITITSFRYYKKVKDD